MVTGMQHIQKTESWSFLTIYKKLTKTDLESCYTLKFNI